MNKEDYQQLFNLLQKYKSVLDPDEYELKNDIEFIIIDVRNSALENYGLILKGEQ